MECGRIRRAVDTLFFFLSSVDFSMSSPMQARILCAIRSSINDCSCKSVNCLDYLFNIKHAIVMKALICQSFYIEFGLTLVKWSHQVLISLQGCFSPMLIFVEKREPEE